MNPTDVHWERPLGSGADAPVMDVVDDEESISNPGSEEHYYQPMEWPDSADPQFNWGDVNPRDRPDQYFNAYNFTGSPAFGMATGRG